jgi:hypothetical protein
MEMINDPASGEYVGLDALGTAGKRPGAWGLSEVLRASLLETTDLAVEEPAVAWPLTLVAGTTMVLRVMDPEGIEYEIFMRERDQ